MKINYEITSNFNKYEFITKPKILLNICDKIEYGVTDTNVFYNRFYNKIEKDFSNNISTHKYGGISMCKIFTYHIICDMFCVCWPKSVYNIKPFKPLIFKECCLKLCNYMKLNNIQDILSPIFGTEILEGNWKEILTILNDIFPEDTHYTIFK